MTLGIAAANHRAEPPSVFVASDTRISRGGSVHDAGVKTYQLAARVVAVASGDAVAAISAADMVRTLMDSAGPDATYFQAVRLLAFFAKRARVEDSTSSGTEFVVAGFLENGAPSLAVIDTRRTPDASYDADDVFLFRTRKDDLLFIPVGNSAGKRVLHSGLERAAREESAVAFERRASSLLWYLASNFNEGDGNAQNEFRSIGGNLSVAFCRVEDGRVSWPVVEVDGHRFRKGFEFRHWDPRWPTPDRIEYDETWCSDVFRSAESSDDRPSEVQIAGVLESLEMIRWRIDDLADERDWYDAPPDPEDAFRTVPPPGE